VLVSGYERVPGGHRARDDTFQVGAADAVAPQVCRNSRALEFSTAPVGAARMSMHPGGAPGRVTWSAVARSMAWIAVRVSGFSVSARLGNTPEIAP
jgi:hypothetical protein